MATKSVIDIEINDAKFKEFTAMFEKYQKSLGKMPGQWGSINKSVSSLQGNFNKIQHALDSIAKSLDKNHVKLKDTNEVASKTAKSFEKMGHFAKSISGHVASTTFNLLKWGSLTTIAAGLLGAGGLFGLSNLSSSAGSLRTQSQSLGVTPGELKSAKLNYGRYGDAEGLLGGISSAQTDLSKQYAFQATGLNPNQSAAKLLPQILSKAADVYKSGPAATAGQRLEVSGLTQFGVTVAQARQYAALSKSEMALNQKKYEQDQRSLELNDALLRRWQDLDVQLDRSKSSIENAFITGLQGLSEPIAKLSSVFTDAVTSLLKSPKIGEWIDRLGVGIQHFATYLESPDFEKDVSSFLDSVSKLGHAIGVIADTLNFLTGGSGGINTGATNGTIFSATGQKGLTDSVLHPDLTAMPDEWKNSFKSARRKTLIPLSEIPKYTASSQTATPGPSSSSNVPWNPFSMSLLVNHTKIPGQDTNINILNAGGYYSSVRGG